MNALSALLEDDLQIGGFAISTAETLRTFLRNRSEVRSLKIGITSGEITHVDIEIFVGEILRELCPGKKFPYEFSLAAIAVAVENLPRLFAENYLTDLAGLRIQEIPMAPRVARLILSKRRENLAVLTNQSKIFAPPVANKNIEFKEYVPASVEIQHTDNRMAKF